ncbi:PUX2, partial [Symbiodinium microadriaticum]
APEGPSAAGAVETDGPVQLGRQLSEEEMKAAAARAKESEQRTVESLGYNPFQPHFSSNSSEVRHQVNSATAGSSISAASSSAKLRPSQREEGGDREGELALVESQVGPEAVAQLNEALFELAYGEADASSRMTCVDTAMKMLANIQRNPNEIKFRCIRLSNVNFRSKVAEVEGGLEVMMAAGFELSQGADGGEEDNETYLRHGPTALTAKGKGEFEGGREAEVQQYLSLCELKLTYTLR